MNCVFRALSDASKPELICYDSLQPKEHNSKAWTSPDSSVQLVTDSHEEYWMCLEYYVFCSISASWPYCMSCSTVVTLSCIEVENCKEKNPLLNENIETPWKFICFYLQCLQLTSFPEILLLSLWMVTLWFCWKYFTLKDFCTMSLCFWAPLLWDVPYLTLPFWKMRMEVFGIPVQVSGIVLEQAERWTKQEPVKPLVTHTAFRQGGRLVSTENMKRSIGLSMPLAGIWPLFYLHPRIMIYEMASWCLGNIACLRLQLIIPKGTVWQTIK